MRQFSIPMMNCHFLLPLAWTLFGASNVLGQATSSSPDALSQFLGDLHSAVGVISSASATATSTPASVSASPTSQPSASSSAAPGHHGLSNRSKLIIAVVCAIVGALLLAAILGVCCCLLYRRRLRRKERIIAANDDEKAGIHSKPEPPLNPGRTYTPLNQHGHTASMESQPRGHAMPLTVQTNTHQHPAHRHQNPFIPVPPSPRKAVYSSGGLTDATAHDPHVAGPHESYSTTNGHYKPYNNTGPHDSYNTGPHESYATAPLMAETQPLRISTQQPRSRSNSRPSSGVLPRSATDRPSTPFGLASIGQPYDDMHVHVLQTEHPSRELQQSLQNREPIQRYHTPPLVPSRSPRRSMAFADSSYQSNSSSNTNSTSSGEEWQRAQTNAGLNPTTIPPWQQRQNRYSDSATGAGLPTPPVPWDDDPHQQRRHSGNGSNSRSSSGDVIITGNGNGNGNGVSHDRRGSRSPATSINGQPRRLRFSDLQASSEHGSAAAPGAGATTASPHASAGYDAWGEHNRYSQGVGEAL